MQFSNINIKSVFLAVGKSGDDWDTFYIEHQVILIHRCQPSRSDRESPVLETLSPVHSSLPFFSRFLHRTFRWFFWIWYYSFLISPSVFTQVQLWLFDECVLLFCLYNYIYDSIIYFQILNISFFIFGVQRYHSWKPPAEIISWVDTYAYQLPTVGIDSHWIRTGFG